MWRGIAAAVVFRRWKIVAFSIAWYLLMLLPNFTNFLKNGFLFFASDRYAYLASAGVFLLIAAAVVRLFDQLPALRKVIGVLTAVMLIGFAWQARMQAFVWENSESLYRNVIAQYPGSSLAHNNLGSLLRKAGRGDEAVEHIGRALAIDPTLTAAHINQGELLKEKGDMAGAIAEFERAVEPLTLKKTLNIDEVGALYILGAAYEEAGRADEALVQFEMAAAKAPHIAEPQYNVGLQYQKLGRADDAIAAFLRATELSRREPDAHYHLAGLYAEQGRLDEALDELEAVLGISPGYPNAAQHAARIKSLLNR